MLDLNIHNRNPKLTQLLVALIILFLTVSSAGAETGLVGYWKMEDNWNDSSGNGNNGTGHGGVGFADGKVGRCGSYGNNKYVDVGDMDNPFDGSSSNMTISMWVKSGGSNSGTVGLVSKGVSGNAIFEFRFYSDDSFSLHARDPGGNNYVTVASGSFDDWVGNWHHIAAVVELNPLNIKLYRDGVDLPTSSSSAGTPPTVWDDIPDSVEIGRLRWAVGTRYFNGLIDEVKIYNRTLSEGEIKAQYYLYLVALYHMDEDSWDGTLFEVIDSSGQGNHGTAYGEAHPVASGHITSGGYDCGNCGSFETNDYVSCGNDSSLNLGTGDFTISTWFRTSQNNNEYSAIYSKVQNDQSKGIQLLRNRNGLGIRGNKLGFSLRGGTGITSNEVINDGIWHNVVIIRSGSNGYMYLDSVLQTVTASDWNINADVGNEFEIGRGRQDNKYYWNGDIDEVAVYNRALTEEEIQTHYEQGPPQGLGPVDIYKGEGTYISSVKDAEKSVSWNKICWEEDANYGEELEPESGMVGFWHMNDNWEDSSGQGNNGTPHGGVGFDSGKFETNCGSFETNDYVSCGNDSSLNLGTGDFTISAWFRTSQNNNVYSAIYSKVQNNQSKGIQLLRNRSEIATGNKLTFALRGGTALNSNNIINDGNWHNVVIIRSGSNGHMYLDNVLQTATASDWNVDADVVNEFEIGRGRQNNKYYWNGDIDEVAIYNRALSASEVLERYKRGVCSLKFQARSGSADPPTGDFVGPDGTTCTYFTDASGDEEGINVPDNRYFQYKAYFSTENKRYTPELSSVTIKYSSDGEGGVSGAYIYQWEEVFE